MYVIEVDQCLARGGTTRVPGEDKQPAYLHVDDGKYRLVHNPEVASRYNTSDEACKEINDDMIYPTAFSVVTLSCAFERFKKDTSMPFGNIPVKAQGLSRPFLESMDVDVDVMMWHARYAMLDKMVEDVPIDVRHSWDEALKRVPYVYRIYKAGGIYSDCVCFNMAIKINQEDQWGWTLRDSLRYRIYGTGDHGKIDKVVFDMIGIARSMRKHCAISVYVDNEATRTSKKVDSCIVALNDEVWFCE